MKALQLIGTPLVVLAGWLVIHAAAPPLAVGSPPKAALKQMAGAAEAPHVEAPSLCVLEDWRKFGIVFVASVGGAYLGLLMRIEHDEVFGKKTFGRRVIYGSVSFVYGVSSTPYLLMRVSETQPLALCLIFATGNAAAAWLVLEVCYQRARGVVVKLFDKILPGSGDGPKPPAP